MTAQNTRFLHVTQVVNLDHEGRRKMRRNHLVTTWNPCQYRSTRRAAELEFSNLNRELQWRTTGGKVDLEVWVKSFLCCTFGKVCSDIPGVCIVLQMILVVALSGVLGYLFVTQELMK